MIVRLSKTLTYADQLLCLGMGFVPWPWLFVHSGHTTLSLLTLMIQAYFMSQVATMNLFVGVVKDAEFNFAIWASLVGKFLELLIHICL